MNRAEKTNIRLRAWRAILKMHATIIPTLDGELRDEAGMDLQTYDALLHTYEAGDAGIRMTDLAGNVVLTKSGLTTLVDRLEKRDLLQRVSDPADRRSTRVSLTARGVETFRSAAPSHLASIDEHFARRLTDDEAAIIVEALERVQENIPLPISER